MDRRRFLGAAAAALVLPAVPVLAEQVDPFYTQPRTLWLARAGHVEELTYWRDGHLVVDGYAKLCWLLRDVKAGQHVQMDVQLLEVLRWLQHYAKAQGFSGPIEILSGFRTVGTNNKLEGAARDSMHLYGKAVDFRLPGVSTDSLGAVLRYLRTGGAGVYAGKGFVHADTGAERAWRG